MSLREKLSEDLKDAMRAKDRLRMETIRSVRSGVLNREVEKGSDLDDAETLQVIRSLVKQREDAIAQYDAGGRKDLADDERREKEILEAYLPAAPDRATIEAAVDAVIGELGASSMKDMGRVMKEAVARLGPTAPGKDVSAVVKQKLS